MSGLQRLLKSVVTKDILLKNAKEIQAGLTPGSVIHRTFDKYIQKGGVINTDRPLEPLDPALSRQFPVVESEVRLLEDQFKKMEQEAFPPWISDEFIKEGGKVDFSKLKSRAYMKPLKQVIDAYEKELQKIPPPPKYDIIGFWASMEQSIEDLVATHAKEKEHAELLLKEIDSQIAQVEKFDKALDGRLTIEEAAKSHPGLIDQVEQEILEDKWDPENPNIAEEERHH